MKVIHFILFAVLFFSISSCQNEDIMSDINSAASESSRKSSDLRSYPGDGKYDVLGWGCDVVQNMYNEKLPVINNDYIIAAFGESEYGGGFLPGITIPDEYRMKAGPMLSLS